MLKKKLILVLASIFLISGIQTARADKNNDGGGNGGGGGDTPIPKIEIAPSKDVGVDFSQVLINTTAATQFIAIKNVGDPSSKLKINSITLEGADQPNFAVQIGRCDSVEIYSGNSCSFPVKFTPLSEGRKRINVIVNTTLSAPDNEIKIPVTGAGATELPPEQPNPAPQPNVPGSDNGKTGDSNTTSEGNGGGCSLNAISTTFNPFLLISFLPLVIFRFRKALR